MSKATKRKHVAKEVLNDYILPEENQQIVKVLAGRGNNLHEVETANKDKFLVSMPTKFRKNVWIKRGDYVLVQPIEEGDRVKAEILSILYKDQVKYIQEQGKWPAAFEATVKSKDNVMISDDLLPPSDSESDNSDKDCTVMNINRQQVAVYEESESESDS